MERIEKQTGYKFYRQYGIGKYIVDFYCPKLKLVVEIDGSTHGTDEEIKNDKVRENYLRNLNLIIKRYDNIDVIESFQAVIGDLQETCEELDLNSPRPSLY